MIGVVVPAHDEQQLLPACLASIKVAAGHPHLNDVTVRVLTVLDACTDDTVSVAGDALEVDVRNVGSARAAGCAALLAHGVRWLATTDADSVVPPDWLAVQLGLARRGADAVAGTVRVDSWGRQPVRVRAAFEATYGRPSDGHLHVHGANLGVSAGAYRSVGGFRPLPVAEDQTLVDALVAAGHRVAATGAIPVSTSARVRSRAPGGFADHLRTLGSCGPEALRSEAGWTLTG